MVKRLPYLALAIILAMGTCVLMGGKVRAASPIMYNGTVQWLVGRRNTTNIEDFNYSAHEDPIPSYGTIPRILNELGGIPCSATNTVYTTWPSYITVHSPDLIKNGGYIYVSFCVAYSVARGSLQQFYYGPANLAARLYTSGSISQAKANGTALSLSYVQNPYSVTEFSIENTYNMNPEGFFLDNFQTYNGSNFPKSAFFLYGTQLGTDNHTRILYGYGDTSTSWTKLRVMNLKITVPKNAYTGNEQRECVYIVLEDAMMGSMHGVQTTIQTTNTLTGVTENTQVWASDMIYLCPVYCYACSSESYEDVEVYLQNINNNLSMLLGGQSSSSSLLESYAALGSEAREAAEEAVRAMSVAQPTFNESDYDVFSNIDSVAMQQFSGVLSFLSLKRILPILLAALALVTIGYLFFGKK